MTPNVLIRPAQSGDELVLFDLINALADYEKLTHQVTGNAGALKTHLFSDRSCIEAVLAECDGKAIGFALFFTSYSTFLTQPCLYLEDLFVLPDYRGKGIGKKLGCNPRGLTQENEATQSSKLYGRRCVGSLRIGHHHR